MKMVMPNNQLRLAGIVHDSIADGPGLRMVVFVQGCPHQCKGCHNMHTWAFEDGEVWTNQKLIEELDGNPLITGVTLSGGEPMMQAALLLQFAKEVKRRAIELAIYSGFLFEDIIKNKDKKALLEQCDVLIDGKFEEDKKSLELNFRGSSNQRIIDVKSSLSAGRAVIINDGRWL